MCPMGDKVKPGSLGAQKLLSDPRGVRFGTGHCLPACCACSIG